MPIRFSYTNLTDTAILTPSSQLSTLPASNLKNPLPTCVWRTSGKTSENLVIDLGSAQQAALVALIGYNLTSAAAVTLQANSSDAWSSPPFSQSLQHHGSIIIKFFDSAQYRYWRLLLADPDNPDDFIQLGRLWLGRYFQPDRDFSKDLSIDTVDPSIITYTASGAKLATLRTPYRRLKISFPSTQQKNTFDPFLSAVGLSQDFIVALDPENLVWPDGLHDYTLYCHLAADPDWSHRIGDRWSLRLDLRETV